jgi:hypothetical protein
MAVNLYSKDSVDTLLAAKLSDAPIDGSTYGRKDGAWEVVSGGGGSYLPLAGGAMNSAALVTLSDLAYDSEIGGWGFGVELTANTSQQAYIAYNEVRVQNGSGSMSLTPGSIVFPDASVQTTAATAGVNLGDVFSISNVQEVTWAGSYPSPGSWTITFRPVNTYIANGMTLYVENGDGTISQDVKGAVSTTSAWTYTTSYDTFPGDAYLYIVANGIKATIPINYP